MASTVNLQDGISSIRKLWANHSHALQYGATIISTGFILGTALTMAVLSDSPEPSETIHVMYAALLDQNSNANFRNKIVQLDCSSVR